MANSFNIVISATDKATAVFRKVNNAADQLTRPFQQAGKSFKSLGQELGFQRIGRDLRDIGRNATSTASSVGAVVAPMAALTGAGTLAGVAALADHWSRLGRATTNAAGNIGVSTQELQRFQGMGQLVGLSTDAATGSLQGLANTLQGAQWGRDNGALNMLASMHIGIKHTASGAIDASANFMQLATAIGKIQNPQTQMLAAAKFGMSEWLPLIRQGPKAMLELQKRAESLGLVMSSSAMKAATDFANSLDNLQGAGIGLKNSVMEQLTPAIKPLVDELAGWIVQNRTLISQDVGEWARDFGKWVQSIDWKGVGDDIHGFVTGVGKTVDALGGWKHAAIAVGVVMNAGLIASVLGLTATLARGAIGLGAFIGLLYKWAKAARAAKTATLESAAAEEVLQQVEKGAGAGRRGLNATGLGLAGLALTAAQISGDQSDSSRDANTLQFEAMAGNWDSAQKLAQIQLKGWLPWSKPPAQAEVDQRAKEIASGAQSGLSPAQMTSRYPQRDAAESRLTQLEGQYHLPAGLLDSVWAKESGRGQHMVSAAGALGHFQFMPKTAEGRGLRDPFDFNQSSDAAAHYLSDLLKANGNDLPKALAAYNWGQGNLDKKGMGSAPAETRNYVADITAAVAAHQASGRAVPPVAVSVQPPAQAAPVVQASAPVPIPPPAVTVNPVVPLAPRDAVPLAKDVPGAESPAPATAPAAQSPAQSPAAAQAAAPAGPYNQVQAEQVLRHEFDVTFNGLPPGASPVIKSKSGAPVSSRIGYTALEGIA